MFCVFAYFGVGLGLSPDVDVLDLVALLFALLFVFGLVILVGCFTSVDSFGGSFVWSRAFVVWVFTWVCYCNVEFAEGCCGFRLFYGAPWVCYLAFGCVLVVLCFVY